MQLDIDRLVQSEMNNYFQQGQMAEVDGEEIVYKIPRVGACRHCLRIHLHPDGTPRKFKLKDVSGNSNYGLPAYAWQFSIGPLHPYCYCVLYREIDKPPPKEKSAAAKRLKLARQRMLRGESEVNS